MRVSSRIRYVGLAGIAALAAAGTLWAVLPASGQGSHGGSLSVDELISNMPDSVPAEQRDVVVSDTRVTRAEFDAAFEKTRQCALAAGVPVQVQEGAGIVLPSFWFAVDSVEHGEQWRSLLDDCKAHHLGTVQHALQIQFTQYRESPEVMPGWWQSVVACMAASGYDATAPDVTTQVAAWAQSGAGAQNLMCNEQADRALEPPAG